MALSVNQLLYYIDTTYSGIDKWGLLHTTPSLTAADLDTAVAAYLTYKQTTDARATSTELHPTAHGTNKTTYALGGKTTTS